MSFAMIWPVGLIVLSNIFYHICAKSSPEAVNPFATLIVTYLVGAITAAIAFVTIGKGTSLTAELKHLNWAPFVLGIAIVGLEVGFIYLYKAGWNVSTGQMVASTVLSICLIFVGWLLYHEQLTASKLIGIAICLVGLYFINK